MSAIYLLLFDLNFVRSCFRSEQIELHSALHSLNHSFPSAKVVQVSRNLVANIKQLWFHTKNRSIRWFLAMNLRLCEARIIEKLL